MLFLVLLSQTFAAQMGVVSEMWLLYAGLPFVKQRQLHSVALPHAWNWAFNFYYFLLVRWTSHHHCCFNGTADGWIPKTGY